MAQISIQDLTFCYDGGSENVFDGVSDICPSAEEWKIMREADLLELDADALYRPFCELSNDERTKLLLAGAVPDRGRGFPYRRTDQSTIQIFIRGCR